MPSKISIVIPVYNEEKTVETLLERVWKQELPLDRELVIIESNSTDQTRKLVVQFAESMNAKNPGSVKLVLQEKPEGKGKAVREGLHEATGDIVLIQDGDLEYDVKDYPQLIEPLIQGKAQFVLGSRHLSAGSWKIRKFGRTRLRSAFMNLGGMLFHALFNFVYGTHLTDPTTMYKVFNRSCLNHFSLVSNRFDLDFELLAKLIRAGFPPLEVPVSYESRGFEDGKKIRVFRDPLTWIWAILKFRFTALR